jgi:hypothetical protein
LLTYALLHFPFFLKTGTTAAGFHKVGKYSWDKGTLKICFRTGTRISKKPSITKRDVIMTIRFKWSQTMKEYKNIQTGNGR